MTLIATLFGGVGLVATAPRLPALMARLEWLGALLLVSSLVDLGFTIARSVG